MVPEPVVKVPRLASSRSPRRTRSAPRPVPASAQPAPREGKPEEQTALAVRGKALLESQLELIQQKLRLLSRRSGLPEHEAEEFRSWALFKLVDDNYRMLGSWEGRSSFSTFLTVVLVNLMRDYRIHIWGKWRPSASARRQGREVVLLERLWVRDGLPLDEAIERMRTEHGVELARAELKEIAETLPRRPDRRRIGEEVLHQIPVDGQVERRIERSERARTVDRLRVALPPLLSSLPAEERLLLRLYYREGLSMAAISPILGRPQRELYSLRDRCLKSLRRSLEQNGLRGEQIQDLAGSFSEDSLPDDTVAWE